MTTIAYDCKTMVSDSLSIIGDLKYETDCQKLFPNVGPFAVLGIAGDYQTAMDFIDIVSAYTTISQVRELTLDKDPKISLVMLGLTKEGTLWYHTGVSSFELRSDIPFAVGSGENYAMGAMAHGASAQEAVLIAARFDLGTNAVLQVATIKVEDDEPSAELTTIH